MYSFPSLIVVTNERVRSGGTSAPPVQKAVAADGQQVAIEAGSA